MVKWLIVITIILGIFLFFGFWYDIYIFHSFSLSYPTAKNEWKKLKRSLEKEGYVVRLIRIEKDCLGGYFFFYTQKNKPQK